MRLFLTDFLYTETGGGRGARSGAAPKWLQLLTAGYDSAKQFGVPAGASS